MRYFSKITIFDHNILYLFLLNISFINCALVEKNVKYKHPSKEELKSYTIKVYKLSYVGNSGDYFIYLYDDPDTKIEWDKVYWTDGFALVLFRIDHIINDEGELCAHVIGKEKKKLSYTLTEFIDWIFVKKTIEKFW